LIWTCSEALRKQVWYCPEAWFCSAVLWLHQTAVVAVASALADGALWFNFGFKNQFDGQFGLIIFIGNFLRVEFIP